MSAPFGPRLSPEERKRRIRQSRESLLRRRGWVRLVERADIWVNVLAEGDEIHSIHIFRSAVEIEMVAESKRKREAKKRLRSIHYNPAAMRAGSKERTPAARGSGQEGDPHAEER